MTCFYWICCVIFEKLLYQRTVAANKHKLHFGFLCWLQVRFVEKKNSISFGVLSENQVFVGVQSVDLNQNHNNDTVCFASFPLSGCIVFFSSRSVGCLVRLKLLVWTELPAPPLQETHPVRSLAAFPSVHVAACEREATCPTTPPLTPPPEIMLPNWTEKKPNFIDFISDVLCFSGSSVAHVRSSCIMLHCVFNRETSCLFVQLLYAYMQNHEINWNKVTCACWLVPTMKWTSK